MVLRSQPVRPIPFVIKRGSCDSQLLAVGGGPKIDLSCPVLLGKYQRFIIDTGGDVTIINKSALQPGTYINPNNRLIARGISGEAVQTLGTVELKIFGLPVQCQVSREDLSVPGVGILGNDCLDIYKPSTFTVSPRTKMIAPVPIKNPGRTQGYLPRIDLPVGLFMGEALVAVDGETATCMMFNTTNEPVTIELEPQILEDYEFHVEDPSNNFSESQDDGPADIKTIEQRTTEILNKIPLKDLDTEQRKQITEIIHDFTDIFHLPGD
ncbi:hypothetical protein KQX54_012658 [Cotesia glomerata]|uniref:Peptidase A2 domain-containing protein n=1 Tax=Cotesia glomerata TaxID=32391 RepID=A0AAV7HXB3_COTGL|nr:hypothetical protein KQX54_012658 [Cotesia glomerata]